jgi:Calcineurin-like phosphoesterase
MLTAILSDLHLGAGTGADLLRRARFREPLLRGLEGADRVVLLGDAIELRDRPIADAFLVAEPFFRELGEALPDAEIVVVPGNHDHHLLESWLERRRLEGAPALELEQRIDPAETALAGLARQLGSERVTIAYPGLWLREDVYATHGHYLDRHLTIPTFERLGVAAVERVLGFEPPGPDPLEPPAGKQRVNPDEYERAQAPVYALLFALAQGSDRERGGGVGPSMRIWNALGGGAGPAARVRGWIVGSVVVPGAVGLANRLGLGPVRSDLSPGAITRAGLAAIADVVERLAIDAGHLIFGHTHRRGPMADESGWTAGATKLWNTGSWVYAPTLLGSNAATSPYWPGTIALVSDAGEPTLRHLLDELERAELEVV